MEEISTILNIVISVKIMHLVIFYILIKVYKSAKSLNLI